MYAFFLMKIYFFGVDVLFLSKMYEISIAVDRGFSNTYLNKNLVFNFKLKIVLS